MIDESGFFLSLICYWIYLDFIKVILYDLGFYNANQTT